MSGTKSGYEKMLESIIASAKLKPLSDEENLQIFKDLNKGIEEFHFLQKIVEKETAEELTGIVLNA